MKLAYPKSPSGFPAELTQTSSAYHKGIKRSILSVMLFLFVYALFIFINIAAIAFIVDLVLHEVLHPLPFFFLLIVLLIVLGLQINFLIFEKKSDTDISIEITRENEPGLFLFIDKLCDEVGSRRPGKIVVSHRNNASVFEKTSFWGLIVPPKKNLEIGLTLIASLDIVEFKAVLAHEFGHFSQSAARVAPYVYSANRVIGQMVYSREFWNGSFSEVANLNWVFSIVGRLIFEFGRLQRYVFIKVYNYMNKTYMQLSREMEFHADSIAVSTTGNVPIISGLKRLVFADYCLNGFNNYIAKGLEEENCLPDNYFKSYADFVSDFIASNHFKSSENGLVRVTEEDMLDFFPERKLVYKNLWESHPSILEREKNTNRILIESTVDDSPAYLLFQNWEKLTENLSGMLMRTQIKSMELKPVIIPSDEYSVKIFKWLSKEIIPKRYNGLYNSRIIARIKTNEIVTNPLKALEFDQIIGDPEKTLALKFKTLRMDISDLIAIGQKNLDVNIFEYDNEKYKWKDAPELIVELTAQRDDCKKILEQKDGEIFMYHWHKAKINPALFEELVLAGKNHENLFSMLDELEPIRELLIPLMQDFYTREQIFRYDQAAFAPGFDKAMRKFYQAMKNIETLAFTSAIGDIKIEKGIINHIWKGKTPEPVSPVFTYEIMEVFWQEFTLALDKLAILQIESHIVILNCYEKIYKPNPTENVH
ncbi:MAG: M48 family metallopeptidase [Bacteroidia bacterium]